MNTYSLEKILDLKKWEPLQNSLSQITQLSILTTDFKGTPITTHSGCSEFCKHVREDAELSKRCQKCDSRGGFEAACSNKPFIYLCHFNIIDIAIPISINDKYIGAVLAGQIKLSDYSPDFKLEQLHVSPTGMSALSTSKELQDLYNAIPSLPYAKIEEISNMLFTLCNYIVDEAKNKNYLLDLYSNINKSQESTPDEMQETIFDIKTSLSQAINNSHIDNFVAGFLNDEHPILSPIIQYLNINRSQMLSLNDAASLVHLSPGHFSRVFSKEIGMSYTTYLMQLKIGWSKQLLEKTSLTVTQISDELGFSDPSYFIKVFKKYENNTPLAYRGGHE